MNSFSEITGLSEQVITALTGMNFTVPTPIQAQSIPLALAGKDILGSAQTGTGKTGAFAIPLVSKIMNNEIQTALILTPTRELAVQVLAQIHAIVGKGSNITTALLIGGEAMPKQLFQLRKNPRIVVGTPGRINDHLERGTVSFKKAGFLVLDETDRMLDMGFGKQIDSILAHFPGKVQTLMFSATMPKNIMQMAAKYLVSPERIEIGSSLKPIEAVEQKNINVTEFDKYDRLLQEIDEREGSIIVFVKTKFGAKNIADKLYRDGCEAQAIHGNLRQSKRDTVLKMFRNNKFRVLVATDVAARGLDVPHIQHVINHDLPQCPEDYIHRIGRTARAGAKGFAINFIADSERRLWKAIERFMSTGDQPPQRSGGRSEGAFSSRSSGGRDGGRDRDRNSSSRRSFSSSRSPRRSEFRGEGDRFESRPERSESRSEGGRPERSERSESRPTNSRFEGRSESRPSRFEGRSESRPNRFEGAARSESRPEGSRFESRSEGGRSESSRSEGGYRSEGARSEGGYRSEGRRSQGGNSFGESRSEGSRSSSSTGSRFKKPSSRFGGSSSSSSSFAGKKRDNKRSNASSSQSFYN